MPRRSNVPPPGTHGGLWTSDERAILRRWYRSRGPQGIHEALPHRTIEAITARAAILGVRFRTTSSRHWTRDEDKVFRAIYPKEGAAAVVARLPHRSPYAVMQRAYRLGLRSGAATPIARSRASRR